MHAEYDRLSSQQKGGSSDGNAAVAQLTSQLEAAKEAVEVAEVRLTHLCLLADSLLWIPTEMKSVGHEVLLSCCRGN